MDSVVHLSSCEIFNNKLEPLRLLIILFMLEFLVCFYSLETYFRTILFLEAKLQVNLFEVHFLLKSAFESCLLNLFN